MAKPKTAKHDRGGGTVLVRTVDRLLACATQAGLDRRKMIDLAGLHDVDFTQPDTHAPISRFVALWQLLAKMNLEAGFGVRFGSSLRVRDVGLVGYAMYYSATLEAAVRRWIRFSRIVDESVVFRLEAARNQRIVAQPAPPLEVSTQPEIDYRLTAVLAAVAN